ncbi:Cupin domain-containing protein [Solimonas aquatica]|uniref:Cupin domain-containing protein n=1 Tax=Solimonas aquatica TaxID=489703 RepID=A0A1H9H8S4_9GAMM|nr:cupin domain-containing protein [Solimonas aquatica]SEQ58657.1 Cupin domain-containing protein [Solimonas aquatica]
MKPAILPACAQPETFTVEGCHVRELSNGAQDETLSIAQVRVACGHSTRWHRLRNTQERYVIVAGRGLMQLQGQAPQEVSAGDVVLIPPGCGQRIQALGDTELVFLAICTPRFVWQAYEDIDTPQP